MKRNLSAQSFSNVSWQFGRIIKDNPNIMELKAEILIEFSCSGLAQASLIAIVSFSLFACQSVCLPVSVFMHVYIYAVSCLCLCLCLCLSRLFLSLKFIRSMYWPNCISQWISVTLSFSQWVFLYVLCLSASLFSPPCVHECCSYPMPCLCVHVSLCVCIGVYVCVYNNARCSVRLKPWNRGAHYNYVM